MQPQPTAGTGARLISLVQTRWGLGLTQYFKASFTATN